MTLLIMPCLHQILANPVIPMRWCDTSGAQEVIQHSAVRCVDVFNWLAGLIPDVDLFEEAGSPVQGELREAV